MAEHHEETTAAIQTEDIDDGNSKTDLINMASEIDHPGQGHDGQTEGENDVDGGMPQFHDVDANEDLYHKSDGDEGEDRPITASDITLQTQDQELDSQHTQMIKDSLDEILLESHDSPAVESTDQQEMQAKIVVWLKSLDPRLVKLIYWHEWKETAIVFAAVLILLLTLKFNSLLSVLSFFGMATLLVTFACRVFNALMQVLHKKPAQNPFQNLLDKEISIPKESILNAINYVLQKSTPIAEYLRNLFLVVDIVESLQFGIGLWLLSCVGSWFSDLTIVIIAVAILFTVPVTYENNQAQFDTYINMAKNEINNIMAQVDGLIPGRNRAKDKED